MMTRINGHIMKRIILFLTILLTSQFVTAQKLAYYTEESDEGTLYGYKTAQGEPYCTVYMIGSMPDPFVSGLRRIVKDGKIGFINKKGVVAIAPEYDMAEPFTKKICAVNKGAIQQELSATDEYALGVRKGGQWGVINNKGAVTLPIKFTQRWNKEADRHEYVAGWQAFHINKKGKVEFIKIATPSK